MDIISEVKALNSKAAELNEARKKALWEKNRAEEELKTALVEYNKKYGTSLTADDISSEFSKVEAEIKAQAEKVKAEIEAIERGEEIVDTGVENDDTVGTHKNSGASENTVASGNTVASENTAASTGTSSEVRKVDAAYIADGSFLFDNTEDFAKQIVGGVATEEKSIDEILASATKEEPIKVEEKSKEEPKKPITTIGGFDFSKYI